LIPRVFPVFPIWKRQSAIAAINNLAINSRANIMPLIIGSFIFRGFRFMIPGDALSRSNKMVMGPVTRQEIHRS
jgi:hypothetical protein